jgi:hypothetical protein
MKRAVGHDDFWQNEAKIMKFFKGDQHATNGCIRVTELTEDATRRQDGNA